MDERGIWGFVFGSGGIWIFLFEILRVVGQISRIGRIGRMGRIIMI